MSDHVHSWRFDGDDPYIVCACGVRQDAITGRLILPRPTGPGTPQTVAVLLSDLDNDPAYLQGVKDGRAAHDAEVRALEYAARNVVAAWKLPNLANAMAFDGLVEALRAILDADTAS